MANFHDTLPLVVAYFDDKQGEEMMFNQTIDNFSILLIVNRACIYLLIMLSQNKEEELYTPVLHSPAIKTPLIAYNLYQNTRRKSSLKIAHSRPSPLSLSSLEAILMIFMLMHHRHAFDEPISLQSNKYESLLISIVLRARGRLWCKTLGGLEK